MKDYCKSIGVYLVGNFILLNVIMVCIEYNLSNISLRWIGVVKEFYNI